MIKQALSNLKKRIKVITGYSSDFKKEASYSYEWYGNTYGGFYVHPDILGSNSIVYSFGIGEDISFDTELIKKHACHVFGFDPTPKSIEWMRNQNLPGNFRFFEYGIDSKTGFVNFHLPKNKNYVSGSILTHRNVDDDNIVTVPMKSFSDIIAEFGHDRISVLKMDIEGSEYEIIDSILSSPVYIDQILIEIHERFFIDGKSKTKKLLSSLKHNGYALFAVSDSLEELSFINIKPPSAGI